MEEWRRFRDSKYDVSSEGRVRNRETGLILKQYYKNNGRVENDYVYVTLYLKEEGSRKYRVHRLVGEVFIPNPEKKEQINHKNNRRDDNRVENLEWCSAQENTDHAYRINCGKKPKKVPIKIIDKKGKEYIFDSKYQAAKFIKENVNCKSNLKKISENISMSLKTGYLVRGYIIKAL